MNNTLMQYKSHNYNNFIIFYAKYLSHEFYFSLDLLIKH